MKLKTLSLLFFSLIFVNLAGANDDFCSIKSNEFVRYQVQALESQITEYQQEIRKYQQLLSNSSCSICNVDGINPCHNGGTCNVNSLYNYTCLCPYNYDGPNCDTKIECKPNSCGVNANCTVFNHRIVCTCPFGYTGNPSSYCNLQMATSCIDGDPHYVTFDGARFDYQGTCPHVLTKKCDSDDDFTVTVTNRLMTTSRTVSSVDSLTTVINGTEFKVTFSGQLIVNGLTAYYPYYYPSISDAEVTVTRSGSTVTILDNNNFAKVVISSIGRSSGLAPCIYLPKTEEFFGNSTVCGVLGNIDNNCADDFVLKNGTKLNIPCSAHSSYPYPIAEFGDSWVTNASANNCVLGEVMANMSSKCNVIGFAPRCKLLQQAITGQGPFAACLQMGADVIQDAYNDCLFDVCEGSSNCDSYEAFVDVCLTQLPFANISNWRTPTFCPYTCPPFSHYSLQTPNCQDTCSDPNLANSSYCEDGFREGCICDPGYYVDTNVANPIYQFVCRPLGECGCNDDDGNYFPPNSTWLDGNCTTSYQCANGRITTETVECAGNAQCVNEEGNPTCSCNAGYSGNGFNCSDIDECILDLLLCGANVGHGKCVNDPGSYHCDCLLPYEGENCENYLPSRHCADLYVFHKENVTGVYTIQAGAKYEEQDPGNATQVYCDMEADGGGWTMISSGGNVTRMKTFEEYAQGFGDPALFQHWLGLENVYVMTNETKTSLRVVINHCAIGSSPATINFCTYPQFSVSSANEQYAVFIPERCQGGNETNRYDGWVSWNPNQLGPKFVAFDNDNTMTNCTEAFEYTGWWYYGRLCGRANLNGLRVSCESEDPYHQFVMWDNDLIQDGQMYLRPAEFPNYDPQSSSN